jgi:TetR/AcrR family fatty acid metabolism transcriptional regulator
MEGILKIFKDSLSTEPDPRKKLRIFLRTYFKMINEDQLLAEVFQVELRQSSKFLKDYHNQKFLDYLNIIGDILHQGVQQGFFRKDLNVGIAKIMIFGAIDEVARQWILGAETKYSLDQAGIQLTNALLDGIKV